MSLMQSKQVHLSNVATTAWLCKLSESVMHAFESSDICVVLQGACTQ